MTQTSSYIPPTPYVPSTVKITKRKKRISEIDKVKMMLQKNGYSVKINNTNTDVRITAKLNGQTYRIEVEKRIKSKFDSRETFPHQEVDFLDYKKAFRRNGEFWYIIVSSSGCMIVMRSEDIYQDGCRKEKICDSEHYKGRDVFYCLDKNECEFINEKNNTMTLCLNCRFTDGKKFFKVIGLEFHPQPDKSLKVFYEFIEEGTQPPKVRMREKDYMCELLKQGKLTYAD